jgi:hypothetical protein
MTIYRLDEFRIQAGKRLRNIYVRLPTDELIIAILHGTVGPCRQLLSAPDCFLRTRGLTHWGNNLVLLFDDDELNRCVSDVCKLVPRRRRHIQQRAGDHIDLADSFLVLDLSLASVHHITQVARM